MCRARWFCSSLGSPHVHWVLCWACRLVNGPPFRHWARRLVVGPAVSWMSPPSHCWARRRMDEPAVSSLGLPSCGWARRLGVGPAVSWMGPSIAVAGCSGRVEVSWRGRVEVGSGCRQWWHGGDRKSKNETRRKSCLI